MRREEARGDRFELGEAVESENLSSAGLANVLGTKRAIAKKAPDNPENFTAASQSTRNHVANVKLLRSNSPVKSILIFG